MINRIIFTAISTIWVWIVYGIQQRWTLPHVSIVMTAVIMLSIPFFMTALWLLIARITFSNENIDGVCFDIEEANNDFLPDYLGYFFIGIGVDDYKVMILMFVIVFVFTLLSQRKLFNPLLLILGYNYYNVTTSNGVKVFIISRKEIRDPGNVRLGNLRRINNMSYIDFGR